MKRKCLETDTVYVTQRVHDINWEKNRNIKCPYQTIENANADSREDKENPPLAFFETEKSQPEVPQLKWKTRLCRVSQCSDGPYIKLGFKILSSLIDSFSDLFSHIRAE